MGARLGARWRKGVVVCGVAGCVDVITASPESLRARCGWRGCGWREGIASRLGSGHGVAGSGSGAFGPSGSGGIGVGRGRIGKRHPLTIGRPVANSTVL